MHFFMFSFSLCLYGLFEVVFYPIIQVFRLQVNNGIPIQSWFDDQSDSALISLLPFLEILAEANDVRPIIANRFNLED